MAAWGLAQRIVRIASAEVGVVESPWGSNSGRRVRQYQAATALGGTGWAWCGAFACWVWAQAGVRDAVHVASPSTAVMCWIARNEGLRCAPRPGAALVWCGRHVEILISHVGGDVWNTVGGNTGQGVHFHRRSVRGALVFAPRQLLNEPLHPPPVTMFWLKDPKARATRSRIYTLKKNRDYALKQQSPARRKRAYLWRVKGKGYGFTVGKKTNYGPWPTMKARAAGRRKLERQLGRKLVPYRTVTKPKG